MNQPDSCTIGVDLGGQSLRLAVVDDRGAIQLRASSPIQRDWPAQRLTDHIVEQINGFLALTRDVGWSPATIGLGMPGYLDAARSKLLYITNLPALNGTAFVSEVKQRVALPMSFDADSNAAAMAEYRFGAGVGVDRLIVAAIGTGIGAGVVIEGRVLRIFNHIAGSLGHVIVNARGPRCPCGARGCVEALASGRAIEAAAEQAATLHPKSKLAELRSRFGPLTGVQITEALDAGDAAAGGVVRESGWWLGAGIASWAAIYGPHKVLIGGGMAALGEPLFNAVRTGLAEVGQPHLVESIIVDRASLGPDAGLIGAAALAQAP